MMVTAGCQRCGQFDGGDQAGRVGDALPGDVEGGAVGATVRTIGRPSVTFTP